jgi:putative restriction endonuclease
MQQTLVHNMSPRSWSFLTVEGTRQYGGNVGYLDDPAKVYRYDSDVANHLRIKRGDVVVLRSKALVIGIARIEEIVEGEGDKERLRCPVCQMTNIKERVEKEPRWKCKIGHVFLEPMRETVKVRTFEAHYAESFQPTPPSLSTERLLDAVIRPSDQMSIKEIDLARIEKYLLEGPGTHKLIVGYANSMTDDASIEPLDMAEQQNSIIETRRRVLREIMLRRGQSQFRNRLIKRYGCVCQVCRCVFPEIVEAAHILPYAETCDNSAKNGLLLRSDFHTLFDLALLAIHPTSMRVALHPALLTAGYAAYSNVPLLLSGTNGPSRVALTRRWELFCAAVGKNPLNSDYGCAAPIS